MATTETKRAKKESLFYQNHDDKLKANNQKL